MNNITKNRLKLIFIAGMFALPVLSAWLVFNNPQWLEGGKTKNYGELISPALASELSDYVINGSQVDMSDLKGRWVLVHIDSDGQCSKSCEKSVHIVRQLNVLLSKDAKRLKRVYLDKSTGESGLFLSNSSELNVFRWNDAYLKKLRGKVKSISDGDMLLMDPLGNIMMKYTQDADPYGIQKDLKLLFKASQIG
ncbi:MAG: hypothetical protein KUG50_00895 [Cycloclasticus sp.]|nr:hypothetical protein [Cycloclasticus sp.]